MDFGDTGIHFNPAVTDVTEKFSKELESMLAVTAEFPRVTQHSNFSQYVQGLISDPPQFRDIVNGSRKYAWSKEAIMKRITQDFDSLGEKVKQLEECRQVHEFEAEFNFKEFAAENHDVETIKNMLTKLANWEDDVGRIAAQHTFGLILSNSRKLKEKLAKKVD